MDNTRTRAHLEAALERHFYRKIRAAGGHTVKLTTNEKGCPDRLVLLPRHPPYLVELKALGGRLSPAQEVWHRRAAALGHPVTTLVGHEAVNRWITAILDTEHSRG